MAKNRFIFFLLLLADALYAQETLVWPPPPDKGRIRYAMDFRGREDVEPPKKENWFIKLLLGPRQFPTHIAVGEDGRVYASDTGNFRFQVFSPEWEFLYAKGGPGDIFGKFAHPKGIDADWNYQIFDEKGQLLTFVGDCGAVLVEQLFQQEFILIEKRGESMWPTREMHL